MEKNQIQPKKVETIVITNFNGRLTRIVNGDLNSGFAKFTMSWGYDPFSKPMNLTWLEQPSSIAGVTDMLLATKNRYEAVPVVYGVGSAGKAYRIHPMSIANPNLDSVIGVGSVTAGSETYNYGASMEFFGTPERMYVGGDKQVNAIPISSVIDGSFGGDAVVGSAANYVTNVTRPLASFGANILFGNGPTIGAISATNTVTSSIIGLSIGSAGITKNVYSQINPPLPPEFVIKDLDVSPDYSYLFMSASETPSEDLLTVAADRQTAASTNSNVSKWNGTDVGITAGTSVPALSIGALQTYLQKNLLFSNDPFGMALGTESAKLLTLQNNKVPFRSATGVNGNYVFWACPEVVNGSTMVGSLYYFGSLDQENPSGLYRLMRYQTSLLNGYVYQIPCAPLVSNEYKTLNNAITSVASFGYGKHYFSTMEVSSSTTQFKLNRFLITPSGTGTPQAGMYETQTQLFSKRIGVSQIRVYTEPTATGNAFRLDMIGNDGAIISNGTFNYGFGDTPDPQSGSNSIERINFNPNTKSSYGLGIRITNTGTTNMVIKKIEVDYTEEGK
jgi:hypothetical protein